MRRLLAVVIFVLGLAGLAWGVVGDVGEVGGYVYEVTYVKKLNNGNSIVAYILVTPAGGLMYEGPFVLGAI